MSVKQGLSDGRNVPPVAGGVAAGPKDGSGFVSGQVGKVAIFLRNPQPVEARLVVLGLGSILLGLLCLGEIKLLPRIVQHAPARFDALGVAASLRLTVM